MRQALTWQGHAPDAYEPALQHAAAKAIFGGRDVPLYGWHYPPFFLAVASSTPCSSRKRSRWNRAAPAGRIQSIFSAARNLGADVPTAYAIQGALALFLAASIAWLWHGDTPLDLKAAALAPGSLLATPYVLGYDRVVLAVAIAFFARHGPPHGFREYEISPCAAAWLAPLLSRAIAGATGIPLGLIVLLAFYGFVLRRAWRDRAVAIHSLELAKA